MVSNLQQSSENRLKRLMLAARKKKDLLEEREKKAKMLTIEHRLPKDWRTNDEGRGTKRKKDWFHVDSNGKISKMMDRLCRDRALQLCCSWGRPDVQSGADVLWGSLFSPCVNCRHMK